MNYDLFVIARLVAPTDQHAIRSAAITSRAGTIPPARTTRFYNLVCTAPPEAACAGTTWRVEHRRRPVRAQTQPLQPCCSDWVSRRRPAAQVPILAAVGLRITTVAGRGRPPNGHVLTVVGFSTVGAPNCVLQNVVDSPGCCTFTNIVR